MRPQTELIATVAVCGLGIAYFGWKAWVAEPDSTNMYLIFIIVSLIVAQRAVKDVLGKMQAEKEAASSENKDTEKNGDPER